MKHVKKIFEKLNSFIKYNLQLYFVFFFGAFRISKKKNIPNMKIIIIVGIIEVKSSFKTTVLKFKTCEYDVKVKSSLLAEALNALTDRKREVILLSYFMEMSDAAIARKMNLVRSTVHEHRTRSLELLKQIMEENKSECKK